MPLFPVARGWIHIEDSMPYRRRIVTKIKYKQRGGHRTISNTYKSLNQICINDNKLNDIYIFTMFIDTYRKSRFYIILFDCLKKTLYLQRKKGNNSSYIKPIR